MKQDSQDNPYGSYLGLIPKDPPLGPETEAFFDAVSEIRNALPPASGPMSMDLSAPCDLNRDGVYDQRDVALFVDMIGECQGDLGYRVTADYDGSGCIDEVDQFELFGRDSDKDGVPDAGDNCLTIANRNQSDLDHDHVGDICDNCPAVFNPDQADSNGNGIGDACEQGANRPPVANAGPDQTVEYKGPNGTPVVLDGSASSDPDGDPLTFVWSGPFGTAEGANPTVTVPLGTHTITLTVNDGKGGNASDTVTISVRYSLTGFFPPVDNLPVLNQVKAGSAVPVKFSLKGDQGMTILAANNPTSKQVSCPNSVPIDAIEETVTASTSGLNYDPATDMYNYVWKTEKTWVGSCRELNVKLIDDTSHTALFNFTK